MMVRHRGVEQYVDLAASVDAVHQAVEAILDHLAFQRRGLAQPMMLETRRRLGIARIIERHDRRRDVPDRFRRAGQPAVRSEEHTSELQSLMRISYAVFCLKKKNKKNQKYK